MATDRAGVPVYVPERPGTVEQLYRERSRPMVSLAYLLTGVSPIKVPDTVWWELERRLVLVFLGRTHGDAVYAAEFSALGRSMARNTAAQAALHPDLVSKDAATVIDVAKQHGALGWKVNGAGGEGGSVTLLLGPSATGKRRLLEAVTQADPLYQVIPTYLSRTGLRVWEAR
jgi:D-glycero-alpha-D-manno-heptose-7-phosphate kinase